MRYLRRAACLLLYMFCATSARRSFSSKGTVHISKEEKKEKMRLNFSSLQLLVSRENGGRLQYFFVSHAVWILVCMGTIGHPLSNFEQELTELLRVDGLEFDSGAERTSFLERQGIDMSRLVKPSRLLPSLLALSLLALSAISHIILAVTVENNGKFSGV